MSFKSPVHVLPGTTFFLPELSCGTTARIHPAYPTIYEDNAAWVARFVPFASEEAMTRALERRYPMWDCLCFPDGITERVFHSTCVNSLMFEVDSFAVLEHAIFDEVSAPEMMDHPFGPAFANLQATFERDMPPRVFARFRASWQDWFTHVQEENKYRKGLYYPTLPDYLRIRRISVGILPCVIAIEYFLGLDLTDALEADPDLVTLGHTAIEHIMLVNDLLSFRAEVFTGDHSNIIAILLRTRANTLQEAVDTTAAMIHDADQALTDLSDRLRDRHPDPAIRSYIDAINSMPAGNLRWSLETTRYIGHGNAWNGLRSGHVTLDFGKTIISASDPAS
jgi:hypothetical protein